MLLRGASSEALAELTSRVGGTRTLADTATMGEQLFGVARILRTDAALRRALTDNSVEGEARSGLARAVFGNALGADALGLVADAAGRRWTSSRDLGEALEHLAAVATVRSAGRDARKVGDELFAVRRMIDTSPELRSALSDTSRTVEDRSALLAGLLGSKTLPATNVLVAEAMNRGRGSLDSALEEFLDTAGEASEETVVTVHTARELSTEETERLAEALGTQYATTVQLHVVVDEDLVGGLRVEIGDDVIDGTVVSRLDDARRLLAG